MREMKSPPRLRLEPRPSRIGCVAIIVACLATVLLLTMLPLPGAAFVGSAVAIVAALTSGLRRCIGRNVPARLFVGTDRRITVVDRSGRSLAGPILDDSYVGSFVTTIIWCVDADPWWRPARAILILPDSLPCDDFRRLRVVLRYGRVAGDARMSDVEAA
jgi:hypothetical protein